MDWTRAPRQTAGIEINTVSDGYIVYHPDRDRVHYLNHTAVMVLELCNGEISAGDIPALVKTAYALPEAPTDEVANCLAKLEEEGLIR